MKRLRKIKLTENQKLACYLTLWVLAIALIMFVFFNLISVEPDFSKSAKWICKTFKYDIDNQYWQYPPIVGLEVGFGSGKDLLWTKTTDCNGQVCFGSGLPDGSYWLNWTYGGEPYWEEVEINCSKLVWEIENVLPAKDFGDLVSI